MNNTTPIRAIFMGTPEFALPSLRRLHESDSIDLIAVLTQPDRPAGRGNKVAISPVKQFALDHNLAVLQPASLRKEPQTIEQLEEKAV